jgi:prepilin-type N-terminal cleavage/methylation domain-containing protein
MNMRSVSTGGVRKLRSGFTLVEMLVASSVMAIVLLVALGSFFAVVSTISAVATRSNLERDKAALAMGLVRDIGNMHNSSLKPVVKEDAVVSFFGSADRLCFIVPDSGSVSGVREIGYEYDDQGNGVIRTDVWLDRDVRNGGRSRAIEPSGYRLKFDYSDGVEWRREWDPERMGSLPAAIRVTLIALNDGEEASASVYRRVVIPGYSYGTILGDSGFREEGYAS